MNPRSARAICTPIHHTIKHKEVPQMQKSAITDAYAERHPPTLLKSIKSQMLTLIRLVVSLYFAM